MTLKTNVDKKVSDCLASYIKANIDSLSLVKPCNITRDYFYQQEIPNNEHIHCSNNINSPIIPLSKNRYYLIEQAKELLQAKTNTNAIVYSPYSCMNWHTNSDDPGIRIYYSYTKKLSIFRYLDHSTGEIVDDIDNIGWTARRFEITDSSNPFWHTIWTESVRFSFGFKL